MSTTAPITAPVRAVRMQQVALPTEHGGWAFLFEPLVAGLAIAFSTGAPWIACLTIGAFLTPATEGSARRPLWNAKQGACEPGLSIFALLRCDIFDGACWYALVGRRPVATAVFGVLPLAVFQIYIDASRQSRKLIPRADWSGRDVCLDRSNRTIGQYAVGKCRRPLGNLCGKVNCLYPVCSRATSSGKGKHYSRMFPTLAHIAALFMTAALAYNGLSPILTIFAMLLLLYRSVSGLSPNRTKMRAMQIGIWEVIYGSLMVLSLVIGRFAGF
ncbi:MAG: YwiC-like family protein [Chloracidobacterium sp.]|nr:YwiC-like family protein [Chloracidobacterium sp.]